MTKQFGHINDMRQFIVEKLSDKSLLGKEGHLIRQSLYVLPYPPEQEASAQALIKAIVGSDFMARGVTAKIIDLYDIVLDYLDSQSYWEQLVEAEGQTDRDALILMMQDTVSASAVISPEVNRQMEEALDADIFFITGVGATYPYVRTHAILSQLPENKPIVLMFPGSFVQDKDGSTALNILGIPQGNTGGYYRATNVFDL